MLTYLRKNRFRIAIIFLVTVFFFGINSQYKQKKIENWFSLTLQTIIYPFQASSNYIFGSISGLFNHYILLQNVSEENVRLKKEIGFLKQENSELYENNLKLERLEKILDLEKTKKYESVTAKVVTEIGEGYSKLLVINKGIFSGIKRNFAVVTPEGAIGKIHSTTPFQSTIQLITDTRSQFPALIQRTRNKATIQGSPNGDLYLMNVPRRLDLKIGDRVIASGLSGIFPKGIFFGKVGEIKKKDYGLFQQAVLVSGVNFSKIEEVVVILSSQSVIHPPLFTEKD